MTNADFQWLTLVFSALGLLLIPVLVMVIRGAARWGRMETSLEDMGRQNAELNKAQEDRIRRLEEQAWGQRREGP